VLDAIEQTKQSRLIGFSEDRNLAPSSNSDTVKVCK